MAIKYGGGNDNETGIKIKIKDDYENNDDDN